MGLRVPFVLSLHFFYSDSVFMLYLYLYSCSLVIYAPNKSCYKISMIFRSTKQVSRILRGGKASQM